MMPPKTAADLTPAEISHFRERLKTRQVSLSVQGQVRLEKARQVAEQAASILRAGFSAVRVVLFGSAVDPDLFHHHSDIDLVVWGIKEQEYYRAVGVLQSLDPEFSIDLVRFEEAGASLQKKILAEGVEL